MMKGKKRAQEGGGASGREQKPNERKSKCCFRSTPSSLPLSSSFRCRSLPLCCFLLIQEGYRRRNGRQGGARKRRQYKDDVEGPKKKDEGHERPSSLLLLQRQSVSMGNSTLLSNSTLSTAHLKRCPARRRPQPHVLRGKACRKNET